ncbi:MAG: hypothetical protein BGO69_04780 [Bacteroidetes bacterium 46-16]|nr:MAG: hypothetical protein BGO69_04780 [Bacteroidetes bacterium 46-16]
MNILYKVRDRIKSYFFSETYNMFPLVMLRVGLSLLLLVQLIQIKSDIFSFIGKYGLIRQDIVSIRVSHFILSSTDFVNYICAHIHWTEMQALNFLGAVYICSLIALSIGLFTRLSAFVAWILHLAFVSSAHFFTYGVDYFLTMLLFYTVIFPVGKAYSIDNLIFKYASTNATPYIRVLQIHMCIVYFISGMAKAIGPNWWNGMSIWKAINRPIITSFNIHYLANFGWLYTLAGIFTIIVEVLYCVFMNLDKTRKLWLLLTCALHLSIAFVLVLPEFAAVMILFNIAAYYYPANKNAQLKFDAQAPSIQDRVVIEV